MKTTIELPAGYRLELWASGPGFLRISQDDATLWQVPAFPAYPDFFKYQHREACVVTVEWDRSEAILWAYGYDAATVAEVGITVWEFGDEGLALRTGAEIDEWMRSDPDRPLMHFSPVRQWMNDPNGLCKIGDTWHMFYQFHPASTDWGPMHWGHATSKDLFNWMHLPVFLHPEQNYWRLGATGGAFSGNAFQDRDGTQRFFYTERLPAYDLFSGYREIQKVAEFGLEPVKAERTSVVLEERPARVAHDFRDPKVWWDVRAQAYRMVLGGSIDGDPAVLLYGASDPSDWTYLGPLYRAPAHFRDQGARAVECPDIFELDGKWVLVMGFVGHTEPDTGRHNLLYALVGEFIDDQFVPHRDELQLLDFGTDYYAMQSFAADGRQIAFAWLFNWEYRKPPGSPYSGEMSLPRELSLTADGRLAMQPAREIEDAWPAELLSPTSANTYILPPKPFEITLKGVLNGTRTAAHQNEMLSFDILIEDDVVSVRLPQDDGNIRYEAQITDARDLRVIFDRGIVEIFVGHGSVCGTRRSYQGIRPDRLEIETEATIQVSVRGKRAI